jgi:methanol--5-hydroxybenzimidazolylcobamide Co-methyltransferase
MNYFGKPLAIADVAELCFGQAPKALTTRRGMVIGGGTVYPELNFTLPDIDINPRTMPSILQQYREMITGALQRAVALEAPGVVVEFETLPPMTQTPQWGIDITKVLVDALEDAFAKHQLRGVMRATPNDTREFRRPPLMRSGEHWDEMIETFVGCAKAGADLLSIESVGGKEIHDEALTNCDLPAVIFANAIMGVCDMRHLWSTISRIANDHHCVAAGDTACGFGNTAMVLAEQKMIPRVFAAVVRAVTAVRSLVAYEQGAVGPGKDCGYENPILKAITGYPMAMEGKSASCAHFSPVGNVAAACCDTWSNESVNNVKLLSGMAPTCSMEQLIYDCRLMNEALKDGPDAVRTLRNWLVRSDIALDPQAIIISPEGSMAIARAIVQSKDHYSAAKAAALCAIDLIATAHRQGRLKLPPREVPWLEQMRGTVESLSDTRSQFIDDMMPLIDTSTFVRQDYDL